MEFALRPRSLTRASLRVPWDEALEIVGGERPLTHHVDGTAKDPSIVSRYRSKGVPIQEIGDALLRWWRRARSLRGEPVTHPGDEEGPMSPYAEAQHQVSRVYFRYHGDSHEWRILKHLLDEWAPMEESAETAAPRKRKSGRRDNPSPTRDDMA